MILNSQHCFCCSELPFQQCCQPILDGKRAINAEALMRSRFSAYVTKNYQYLWQTYTQSQRSKISIRELADSAKHTQWLSLQVIEHRNFGDHAQVEFKAFYKIAEQFYVMHELSNFELLDKSWLYSTGVIQNKSGEFKPERNNPCPCGSRIKFKKCCG